MDNLISKQELRPNAFESGQQTHESGGRRRSEGNITRIDGQAVEKPLKNVNLVA